MPPAGSFPITVMRERTVRSFPLRQLTLILVNDRLLLVSRGEMIRDSSTQRLHQKGIDRSVLTVRHRKETRMPELDIRGKVCPDPTMEVYKALERLPVGESLTVISDYPPARQTIPPIAQRFNCSCEIRDTTGGQFLILIAHVAVAGVVSH